MATVRQVSRSTPASVAATVPQQGAFSAPPSLAVCSHKEAVDYLTLSIQKKSSLALMSDGCTLATALKLGSAIVIRK